MASMTVLEREIEKQSLEKQASAQSAVSDAQREHDRLIGENYRNLLRNDEDNRFDRLNPSASSTVKTYDISAPLLSDRAPAYQQPAYSASEYHPPVVPSVPGAPSAKQRIDDYVPVTVGMQSVRRFADMPVGHNVVDYAPVLNAPAAAPETQNAPARQLFGDIEFKNGEVYRTPADDYETATVYAPSEMPSYAPEAIETASDEDEDALPTPRTMESIRRAQEQEEEQKTTFLGALSFKAKLALAAVAVAVVVLLAVICINTAILNSLNSEVAARRAELTELTATSSRIDEELGELTSPESVERWALEHGMNR